MKKQKFKKELDLQLFRFNFEFARILLNGLTTICYAPFFLKPKIVLLLAKQKK